LANKNTIRVSEFEKLYYDNDKPFKEKHWQALCFYQEQQYKKGESGVEYFRILNKGVQFTNYVGVIQAGNLTIEVLPKTDKQKSTAANLSVSELEKSDNEASHAKQCWHNVLLQMLKECKLLQVNHVDYARLNLKSNSILEIYLELFLAEAEKLLHEGLIKKYKKIERNQLAMKGQLMFSKNISLNFVHDERFYVRYTEYNRDNIFNQILFKTLRLIPTLSSNPFLSDRVNRLLLDFPEMSDCRVTTDTFGKLIYDRKTQRYKQAILVSKMLLLNYRPDITGGSENVMAILFDMNELWEEFVYRQLVKGAKEGVSVSRQNKKAFWYNQTINFHKQVRPDIVVTKEERKFILDTKWKIIDDNRPGDDDLKQMFVYNLLWDAEKSILLYPGNYRTCNGSYYHFNLSNSRRKSEDEKFFNSCSLAFIDLLDESGNLVSGKPFEELLKLL
jgi:5-methylcytosine-specific restriction enzyme subunit McrC